MENTARLSLYVPKSQHKKFTDEEVECCYEEFYEDVHTEFLKYGEIVNFKVCKNGSFHLRGNVYVHYNSLDSAVVAYNANNGRFYGGRQVICEFVNVTRWKVAICGEFMKTRYKTCSHGTACNFIHCFRNPGGDYEWADSDKPPPRYWVKKMAFLFGNFDESGYYLRKYKSKDLEHSKDIGSNRSKNGENDYGWTGHYCKPKVLEKQQSFEKEAYDKANLKDDQQRRYRFNNADSDDEIVEGVRRHQSSNRRVRVENVDHDVSKNTSSEIDKEWSSGDRDKDRHRRKRRKNNGHASKTSKVRDGSPSSKSIVNDSDTHHENRFDSNEEKHLTYGRKSKRQWSEVTKASDDKKERKSKWSTDYHSKGSSAGKSSSHAERISRDSNTRDIHNIDSLHSDVLSDESLEPSMSDQYVERFRPLDPGKGYHLNEQIKASRWEPGKTCEEFEKSGSPDPYVRSESGILGTVDYHDNKVSKQNHRKSKSGDLYEHRSSRRNSSGHEDDRQTSGDSNSEMKNHDENNLKKNSRSPTHSRKKRHRRSLEKETDASDSYLESHRNHKDLSRHRTRELHNTGKRERSRS